jgi:type III secretory pathway component EscV
MPQPVKASLPPDVEASVREGIKEAQGGEFIDLSREENEHYLETGELPERVERWLDSYDARRAT